MSTDALDLLRLAIPLVRDVGFVLLDVEGVVIGWFGGTEEILGYSASEILGQPFAVLFTPEDIEKGADIQELELARRDSYSHDDRWHVRRDGQLVWIAGTVTAVRDHSGLRGFIKIIRDRTDQRMTAENRANRLQAAEEATHRMQRFLNTLGHEIRNPLAPIKTAAHIVRKSSEDVRAMKAAETIANQVAVLERITADLMDVVRLRHKKLELRLSEFDVRTLIEEECAGQMPIAQAKGVGLETILPVRPLPVLADPERLRQAVINLLTNAVKYTPTHGRIWVKATQEADDVVVRVEDTGIGIDPDVLPRIFEIFTREQMAKDLVPTGLGIGLTIVSEIAELHGGTATARSGGKGKGAEFSLRIPRFGPTERSDPGSSHESSDA